MRIFKPVRNGFSLIELLTVIAIIAILAAILFPVFSRVREKGRQTSCISNMHELYVAMRLYREDNNKYPASLLGFAQTTNYFSKPKADGTVSCNAPQADGTPAPGDTTEHCFYPDSGNIATIPELSYKPLFNSQKYLKAQEPFACPDSPYNNPRNTSPNAVTTAYYPPGLAAYTTNYTVTTVKQYSKLIKDNCCRAIPYNPPQDIYFYKYDSYDIGPALNANGKLDSSHFEVHYSLDWTGNSGPTDPQNQLKYADAPEDKTVVTWCTYHAAIAGADMTLVMMLNGKARAVPAKEFYQRGPLGIAP